MGLKEFLELAKDGSALTLVLIALFCIGIFILRYLWPFVTNLVEKQQAQLTEQIRQGNEQTKEANQRYEYVTEAFLKHSDKHTQALERLVTEVSSMRQDIRDLRKQ